ncbi:hypothetical protein WK53_17010 [Burkholderia ubonensis]|uniref:Uncharacterized protein n=1 Tax=Burkholderia ubonensis TaxID=101571 RepID=A0AAW3N7N7_9BURK|nr:hypothetical protein WK53_17010 [Burkholderia ubonensis]
MASKGGAITIAAEFGQPSHHGGFLVVQTFDQQMTPVGLRDDLFMAEQVAQLPLQFSGVVFGG